MSLYLIVSITSTQHFSREQLTLDLQLCLDQGKVILVLESHCPACFPTISARPAGDYLDYVCSLNQKLEDIVRFVFHHSSLI